MKSQASGKQGQYLIEDFFRTNFKVECVPITQEQRKTADYLLKKDGKSFAVCEVKAIEEHGHRPTCEKAKDGGWLCYANDISRIGHKIQEAYPQLQKYNEPKMLAIVDFDDLVNPSGLLSAAVTGKGGTDRVIVTETLQGVDIAQNSDHVAKGKIKTIVQRIDLYFWINARTKQFFTRTFSHNQAGKKLQRLFI